MKGLTHRYANRRYPSDECFMSGSLQLLLFRTVGRPVKLTDSRERHLNVIPVSNKSRRLEI